MPTGHTIKKTLTPYRVGLLNRLRAGPVIRRSVAAPERRQFNDLCLFGWAADDGKSYTLTALGQKKLDTYRIGETAEAVAGDLS